MSSGGEYYPGTDERIVVVTGDENQIIDISNYIVEKTEDPGRDSSMKTVEIDEYRKQQIKIVLTDAASGLLIGRGGLTIQAIQEESKAKMSVAMPDKITVSGERMVTIRGNSIEERSHACKLVIKQVAADTSNMMNTKTKYYSEVGGAMDMSPAICLSVRVIHSSTFDVTFDVLLKVLNSSRHCSSTERVFFNSVKILEST